MNHVESPTEIVPAEADQLEESGQQPRAIGSRLSDFRERVIRALHGIDRGPLDEPGSEPVASVQPATAQARARDISEVVAEVPARTQDARFPVAPLGYSRAAVEERIAMLERELAELRADDPVLTITDEIERLGEQTASILVVAHDQAHETARLAQEQADRCIADAESNVIAMTEEAKRKLHELDSETDAVWRERNRLLEDARTIGLSLIALSEEAIERFPPEQKPVQTGP